MRIGMIGLGLMGSAFAQLWLKAGHEVIGWNRDASKLVSLVAAGGIAAAEPLAVFAQSDVVISMLAHDQAYQEVFLDAGLIAAAPADALHVNMATVSVAISQQLEAAHEAHGQHYIAATVMGNSLLAQAGKVHVLASGDATRIESLRPIFSVIGQSLRIVGAEVQAAVVAKIAMNFLLHSAVEALAEAHQLVRTYGLASAVFQEIIDHTVLGSPAYQTYGGKIATQTFTPAAFRLVLAQKDVLLAQQTAAAAGVALPLGETVRLQLDAAVAAGLGEQDLAALGSFA